MHVWFTPEQASPAAALVIADTEYDVPFPAFQGPDHSNVSIVLAGDWPIPAGPTPP